MIEPQVFNAPWSLIDDGKRICLQDFAELRLRYTLTQRNWKPDADVNPLVQQRPKCAALARAAYAAKAASM